MGALDYVILAAVAVWFLAAMRSILKKKGGCGCCSGSKGKCRAFENSCRADCCSRAGEGAKGCQSCSCGKG